MNAATLNETIDVARLHDMSLRGEAPVIVDVRTRGEYRSVHVRGAVNVPLDELSCERLAEVSGDGPVYIVCESGGRARKACEKLQAEGVVCGVVVEGGTAAWDRAGYPVQRDKAGVISLERQVRIAAGALVAAGVALGVWQSPWWLVVPGFVGCGLVFAGVTDTCGMGLLLAKMPWNRGG